MTEGKQNVIIWISIAIAIVLTFWILKMISKRIKNEANKLQAIATMPTPTDEDYINAAKINAALPKGWFVWQDEDEAVKIVRLYNNITYKQLYRAYYEKFNADLTKELYDELSSKRYKSIAHIVTI